MPNALPTNSSLHPVAMGWKAGTLFSSYITGMAYPLLVDADSGRLLCDIGSNITVTTQFPATQSVAGTVAVSNASFIANTPSASVALVTGAVGGVATYSLPTNATKSLEVQNTSATGVLYLSTNASPLAGNSIIISPYQGYQFAAVPTNQYYLSASAVGTTYAVIYA